MRINISDWKEFRIGDYFDIKPTKAIDGLSAEDCTGQGVPLVVNSADNNGIAGFCNRDATEQGNIITFSDTTDGNTFFYQPGPFIGFAHVQGMYPKTRVWSPYEFLFLSTVLMFDSKDRFSYGRKMRRDIILETRIKLPQSSDGTPDWQFMEDYIKSLHYKPISTRNERNDFTVSVNEWKEFRLKDIFNLKGGFYNKKPEHSSEGSFPFLGSTENNNGVTEFYSLDDIFVWDKTGGQDNTFDKKIFDGNCITVTVNGSVCNAFYQKEKFTCSHDITALYLIGHDMNQYIALFLCTIIMMDKYRWSYGRKPHDVKKFGRSFIKLPVNSDGIPDWQYMEDYIKSLPYGDRI